MPNTAIKNGLSLTLLVVGHDVLDLLVGPGAEELYQHALLGPRTLCNNRSGVTSLACATRNCS